MARGRAKMKISQRVQTSPSQRIGVVLGLLGLGWGLLGACTTTRVQQRKEVDVHAHWPKKPTASTSLVRPATPSRPVTPPLRPQPERLAGAPQAGGRWRSAALAHAFLLNGGAQPQLNFYSHVLYLRMMLGTLQGRGMSSPAMTVFASDGDDPSEDLLVLRSRNVVGSELFAHIPESRFFAEKPKLVNTQIQGARLLAATQEVLRDQTRRIAQQIAPEDPRPVLMFVTDHGTQNRDSSTRNHYISLWRDNLDVQSYHRMLQPFGARRVISVMSQCFSGSFAWSIYPQPSQLNVPSGDRCGFFATTPDRPAYGCFADTRLGESIGHAYHFILAMKHAKTFDEAHRTVLLTDRTPDVPIRSSDSYLRSILEAEAREQGVTLTDLTDRLLRRYAAQKDTATQEDQAMILAVARRFDLPRPVSIAASHEQQKVLQQRYQWWKNVENQWQTLFRTARDHHLKRWYAQNPKMQHLVRMELQRLAQHTHATPTLAQLVWHGPSWSQERIACVREPYRGGGDAEDSAIGERLRDGFLRYVQGVPGLALRLKQMHEKEQEMHRYVFWLQIQSAALLRIDHLLYRMAGRFLLEADARPEVRAYRGGLARLLACEATPLGPKPAPSAAEKPFLAMKSPPLPSWLGIQFRPLQGAMGLPKGAVLVRLVGVGSPAEKAGLRVGDTVVEVGGAPLHEPYEIRERVMLAPADQPLPMAVLREGKSLTLSLQLQRMTTEPQLKHPPVLGQSIRSWMTIHTFPHDPQKPYAREALPALAKDTVLFFFWATWCGPCKPPIPMIRRWQKKYASKGFKVVAVSSESLQVLDDWLKQHPRKMPFAHVSDPNGFFSAQFRIRATPTFALLHRGRVVLYQVGAYNIVGIEKTLGKVLGASPSP